MLIFLSGLSWKEEGVIFSRLESRLRRNWVSKLREVMYDLDVSKNGMSGGFG